LVYADLPPGQQPLDWSTRINILLGAAKGLEYLHSKAPPVINRDVKCENILLGEGYHPKLSDFGLARLGPTGDIPMFQPELRIQQGIVQQRI